MYKSKICRLFIPIAQTPEIYIAFIMMKIVIDYNKNIVYQSFKHPIGTT